MHIFVTLGKTQTKMLFSGRTTKVQDQEPHPPRPKLFIFFSSLDEKKVLFCLLVIGSLPPSPLSGPTLKKNVVCVFPYL